MNGEGDVLKDKSDYEARTFRLPPDLLDIMDLYSEYTGVSRTAIVEKALRRYLDSEIPKEKGLEEIWKRNRE